MDRLSLLAGVDPRPADRPSLECELGRAVLLLVHRMTTPRTAAP
jgi:hypothetical protein